MKAELQRLIDGVRLRPDRALELPAEPKIVSLEDVLKGRAIELWSDAAGRIFIVANEEDTRLLREPTSGRRSSTERLESRRRP